MKTRSHSSILLLCAGLLLCLFAFSSSNCCKNPSDNDQETIMDIDGNEYLIVQIGNQWWMAENLKVTHYRNGDAIANVTDPTAWSGLSTGAYSSYDNDEDNKDDYGLLYNWHAVNDARNIAPEGWHVPTDAEWKTLEMFLGMSQVDADGTGLRGTDEGGKLKKTGTSRWNSPNTGATNETGFSALSGGFRDFAGGFLELGALACFWSTTQIDANYGWPRVLDYNSAHIYRPYNYGKRDGLSIRCVKD